jgi:nucleoside 2-deoxyribosyltransferase
MRVYLAGGLQTDWQEKAARLLRHKYSNIDILDPKSLQPRNLPIEEIADIERNWIISADIVLAFLEEDNPLPMGLCAELGFAHALGKPTLLVDGYNNKKSRWLAQFTKCLVFTNLEEAINSLAKSHR